jgi:two-component system, OmpR family, response regulator
MGKVKRILVIDDSTVMLDRVKRSLEFEGYEVLATTQIVGNARHLPTCDLVIIDFHMPGLDGSSVVSSMRSLAHSMKSVCPLFVYTSDEKIAAMHAQLGFDGAFTAKGDARALVRQVAAVFRSIDMRAEKEKRAAEGAASRSNIGVPPKRGAL